MMGPGKYDDLCTQVRTQAKARGAMVIILEGDKGSGFSVQLDATLMVGFPEVLRKVADEIDGDRLSREPRR